MKKTAAPTTLTSLIWQDDVQTVRLYFDGRDAAKPNWTHLCIALQNQNTAMAKLLVTWGARPTPDELAEFLAKRGNTAEADIKRLKLAGLRIPDAAKATRRAAFKTAAKKTSPDPAIIPEPWKKMLKALQENGAPEAVIAGGCLSDLYNGREVASVDIFVKSPVFMSRSFLKKAMKASGLSLYLYGDFDEKHFIATEKMAGTNSSYDQSACDLGHVRTWQWKAHWPAIELNFIFMSSPLAENMRQDCQRGGPVARRASQKEFLQRLDVGLCQILFDGTDVVTTDAYDRDAANRTLTLCQPLHTSVEHLRRVVEKYPRHRPCGAICAALETKRVQPPTPRDNGLFYPPMSW